MRQRGNRSALMAEENIDAWAAFLWVDGARTGHFPQQKGSPRADHQSNQAQTSRHRWCTKYAVCLFSFPWQESDEEGLVHKFMNDLHKYVSFIPRAQETKGQHQRSKSPLHQAWDGEAHICHKTEKKTILAKRVCVPWLQCFAVSDSVEIVTF